MSLLTNSFEIRHVDTSDRNKKFAVISGFLDISNPEEVKNFIKSIKEQHSLVMGILNKPEQVTIPPGEIAELPRNLKVGDELEITAAFSLKNSPEPIKQE